MPHRCCLKFLYSLIIVFCSIGQVNALECIAPANPDSEWDLSCRTIGRILFDLGAVSEQIEVTNMPGGGGGLAFSHVALERATDEELIVATSSELTTSLAQNAFGGLKADQVRFLGAIGADPGILAVSKDSSIQSLNELLEMVVNDPESVTFAGGSAIGGYDHLKILMALNQKGFNDPRSIKYVGMAGGRDAITQTMEGFVEVMSGDISEVADYLKSGEVRILAVFSEERIPGFEEIPTAREQGVEVVAINWHGFYVPKDISNEVLSEWTDALMQVANSSEWKFEMEEYRLTPFSKFGSEFQNYVEKMIGELNGLSKDIGILQ